MFDCHSHVQFAAFEKDWKEVIDRSLRAGVSMINVGTQRDTSAKAIEVAHQYEKGVYAAVGLHPVHTRRSYHDAQEIGGADEEGFHSRAEEFDLNLYKKMAADPKVVAIGECGLDYYRLTESPEEILAIKAKQREVFIGHVRVAEATGKALMLHCRPSRGTDDAYEDLLQVLRELEFPTDRCVLHFYVGSAVMTKKFLDAGFNFEFGGVTTFTTDYDEQLKMVPLNCITLETDSPYVAPAPYRGQRNEPAYVVEVAKKLAQIKGVSYDEVERQTDANVKRIFGI